MSNIFFEKKKGRADIHKNRDKKKSLNLMIKNISLKCNFTAHKRNSISYARVFEKYVYLNKKRALVMIDLGAIGNFISRRLVNKFEVKRKFKKDSYNLMILNKGSLSSDDDQVLYEIELITLMMSTHKKQLFLNIIRMINHDIVLKFS